MIPPETLVQIRQSIDAAKRQRVTALNLAKLIRYFELTDEQVREIGYVTRKSAGTWWVMLANRVPAAREHRRRDR